MDSKTPRQAGADLIVASEEAIEAAAWVLADHTFAEGQPSIQAARCLVRAALQAMREVPSEPQGQTPTPAP